VIGISPSFHQRPGPSSLTIAIAWYNPLVPAVSSDKAYSSREDSPSFFSESFPRPTFVSIISLCRSALPSKSVFFLVGVRGQKHQDESFTVDASPLAVFWKRTAISPLTLYVSPSGCLPPPAASLQCTPALDTSFPPPCRIAFDFLSYLTFCFLGVTFHHDSGPSAHLPTFIARPLLNFSVKSPFLPKNWSLPPKGHLVNRSNPPQSSPQLLTTPSFKPPPLSLIYCTMLLVYYFRP